MPALRHERGSGSSRTLVHHPNAAVSAHLASLRYGGKHVISVSAGCEGVVSAAAKKALADRAGVPLVR